jgi:uncharacterized phage protein gp47/JayE
MAGLTDTGFRRKTLDEILTGIIEHQRGRISAQLDTSERTVLGNVDAINSDQLSLLWELFEEVVRQFDPDNATGDQMVSLALLAGVERRGQTKGLVTATVNLAAAKTFAPGSLVAHVLNEPGNRWVNRDTVTSTISGNYAAVFESESAGPDAQAAAGTLTIIAGPVTGWNSITNAADATPGTAEESVEDLRARREASLSLAGSGTVDAIRADILQVTGVEQVLVEENTTDAALGGISAHSFRATVWDGNPGAADDNDIAQAIHDTRPAGIASVGSQSGNATTVDGQVVVVAFERATAVDIYIDVDVISAVGVTIADVKAAVLAAMPTSIGEDVNYHRISAAVFNVPGVDDYGFVQVGNAPAPSGTSNITIGATEIAQLSSSNIVVTGDAT